MFSYSRSLVIFLSLGLFLCSAGTALAQNAILSWTAPTTDQGGGALTGLSGYRVHYGFSTGSLINTIDVGNVTSYGLNLPSGTYFFAVNAYDPSGNQSINSNLVSKTIVGPTATATVAQTATATNAVPTNTRTPSPTITRTPTSTNTRTATPTGSISATATRTPIASATPQVVPSATASPVPTSTAIPNEPTATPSAPELLAGLQPMLECVDRVVDGSSIAYFGYLNQSSQELSVPLGAMNNFAPGVQNRGQIQRFLSGRIVNAFSVQFQTEALEWNLASKSAKADLSSPSCCNGLVDLCGVCNGNNACIGCMNQSDFITKLDRCGICNGDGRSCLKCIVKDFASVRDSSLRAVQKLKRNSLKVLGSGSDSALTKLRALIKRLSASSRNQLSGLAVNAESCSNSELCQSLDRGAAMNSVLLNSDKIIKKSLRFLKGQSSSKHPSYKLKSAALRSGLSQSLNSMPRFESKCD